MGEVRQQIQQVDDDYLAGLSNKGIVKRAYKDLNQEQPTAVWQEDEVKVTLREETCVIRVPLGKSSCSCPSCGDGNFMAAKRAWEKGDFAGL